MQTAFDAFEACMLRVRSLHALHGALSSTLTSAVDLSDILRSEIVLAVSAFDFFIHEISRIGMLECHSGIREKTDAFEKFPLPMRVAVDMADAQKAVQSLGSEIRVKHGYLTFQHPDNVASAIRLFSDVSLWPQVAIECGEEMKDLKRRFILIIERRNKIAHEADIDPSYPGQRWPIDSMAVESTFDSIENVARAIFKVACV